ncbi:MAG: Ppx/GppA phosphatase family protein [Acidimicrobiia bacterium]
MAPGPTENVAAIDVGTNSVHLVVARMFEGAAGPRFEVLDRLKEMVRLGSSASDMKSLLPDAMDRGIAALDRCRQIAEVHDARIAAVATSAVREAENRDEFITRAWKEAGIHVEVISGSEEARLIHLGVLQSVPVFDRRLVLCDIGGGSTELLVGERGEVLASRSLKLGAIRLTSRFFSGDRLHPAAVDTCRRYVRSTLAPFARDVRRLAPQVAVGSSGTIEALATMAVVRSTGNAARTVNNRALRRDELAGVVADLVAAPTVAARAELPGLEDRRADIILGGALVLEQVMSELDLDEMLISEYALREGVLLDTWRRRHGGSLHHLSDLRRRSVQHLVEVMDEDPTHAATLARLALQLFDEVGDRLGLDDEHRELLEAAALLSNVGQFISHSGHHKHGYYVIRSSEHLAGFNEHELELIALVVRYHRKSAPKAKHAEFAALSGEDQDVVRRLASLLRLAVGLDRNRSDRVAEVRCRKGGGTLRIQVVPRPDQDIGLELYAATARKELLEEVLGIPVVVEAA